MLDAANVFGLRCGGGLGFGGLFGNVFHHVIGGLWSVESLTVFCGRMWFDVAKMLYRG